MEPISAVSISPLINKCKVKVCYVSDKPNRNGTVITKQVAEDMGRALPGSPVVGYFNKEKNDFEEHSRAINIENGEYKLIDITKPYGFVPTDAEVWFQKFNESGIEREYLVTECYLWTEIYPECKRVAEKGNNQSMELTNDTGFWAKDNNSNRRIFIYNEALIQKLCILGEENEPCFEGAQITSVSPTIDRQEFNEFTSKMYSMISELQETLNKGGSQTMTEQVTNTVSAVEANPASAVENPTPAPAATPISEFAQKPEEEKKNDKQEPPANPKDKEEPEDKKKKYNLSEVVEYQELIKQYAVLQNEYAVLQQQKAIADTELASLREFKLAADRQAKQGMIDKFSMLTDEQKKDVVEHMDTYSLDDIEAKLSVACIRSGVNFAQQPQQQPANAPQGLFALGNPGVGAGNNDIPEWIKAVQANAQN